MAIESPWARVLLCRLSYFPGFFTFAPGENVTEQRVPELDLIPDEVSARSLLIRAICRTSKFSSGPTTAPR